MINWGTLSTFDASLATGAKDEEFERKEKENPIADGIGLMSANIGRIADSLGDRNEIEYIKVLNEQIEASKKQFSIAYEEILKCQTNDVLNNYFDDEDEMSYNTQGEILLKKINKCIKQVYSTYYKNCEIYNLVDIWNKNGEIKLKEEEILTKVAVFPYWSHNKCNFFAINLNNLNQWKLVFEKTMSWCGNCKYIHFVITGESEHYVVLDLYYTKPNYEYLGGYGKIKSSSQTLTGIVVPKKQVVILHNALITMNYGTGYSEWGLDFFQLNNPIELW